MTAELQSELELMVVEREIRRLLLAYCQGVDRRDWERVRACYHDGAMDSHGAFKGDADELVEWLRHRHESVISSMHVMTNLSIRVSDDRRQARVESYCISLQLVEPRDGDPFAGQSDRPVFTTVGCRYLDTLECRTDLGWRIKDRTVVFEWMRREETSSFVSLDPAWVSARRDSSDPLYATWLAPEKQDS